MSNPHWTYRNQRAAGWSRIDMLLSLYTAAIQTLEAARSALEQDDVSLATQKILRCQRLVLALISGIDQDQGEVAERIQQLCLFVHERLNEVNDDRLVDALRVLRPLREGFQEIRDQAVELEINGDIPPISDTNALDHTIA